MERGRPIGGAAMLTENQMRQLNQISKHNQALFVDVETRLNYCPEGFDVSKIIRRALLRLAELMRRPRPQPIAPRPPILPALGPVLYDLVIATVKYGYGTTEQATDPIAWLKFAGQQRQQFKPGQRPALVDSKIQAMLDGLKLVKTEVQASQVIRKYRRC